jgi:5-methylcytosine-specific restriction protein A
MNSSDAEYAAGLVARRLGLPVKAQLTASDRLVLTPAEMHENEGFSVEVRTSWRTIEVHFAPGRFARPLIQKMGEASAEAKLGFSALATAAVRHGKLIFRVNGADIDSKDSSTWPAQWQKVELVLRKQGVVFEEIDGVQLKQLLGDMVAPMFGMCIALIGVEDVETDPSAFEGKTVEAISQRYERKPVNREICLSVRGRRCYCCNMDFGELYGPSADGYIEVHHITPASDMGSGYQINPVTELVPICSNCHSVVHLATPPRSVEEVKALYDKKQNSK